MEEETFEKKDYTNFNFPAVGDVVSEWTKTVSLFDSSYLKAQDDSTFKTLEQLSLSDGFPKEFDDVMANLSTSVNQCITELNSYIVELKEKDSSLEGLMPKPPRGPSGSNGPDGPDGADDPDETEGPDGPEDQITDPETGIDNAKEQLSYLSDISLSDLQSVVDVLNTVATDNKISIDQLLDDETLGAQIKDLLLKNVKLSDTYKQMIEEGSVVSLVTSLKSLINGEVKEAFGLDEDTELTLKSYLINIAKDNNLDYSDLVSMDDNSNVLKTALSSMKVLNQTLSTFTEDNVQSKLLAIYDGDLADMKIDDVSQNIIKSHIEVLSSLTNIGYEELLTEPAYSKEMFNVMERLQRTTIFADLLSNTGSSSSILSSLGK